MTGAVPRRAAASLHVVCGGPSKGAKALITIIGLLAAALTSLSYIPQVQKALPRGSTGDLSFKTLSVLASGLALWVVYGFLNGDYVIIAANLLGFGLVATLIAFKLRDRHASRAPAN
jgi:MtN3 and saliva related transmembrane protein